MALNSTLSSSGLPSAFVALRLSSKAPNACRMARRGLEVNVAGFPLSHPRLELKCQLLLELRRV
eukprot:9493008-Pyramimonas_sp.AAC.1